MNTLTVWFFRLYQRVGFVGCSSHSGRRTFITQLAQNVGNGRGSLRDVQIIAGHARLDTTERYIEPSRDVTNLIHSLGTEEDASRITQARQRHRRGARPQWQRPAARTRKKRRASNRGDDA